MTPKIVFTWLAWLVFGLLAAVAGAGDGTFDHGLLWKVESEHAAPSYLFGTMHSEDPEVLRLPAAVQRAFDSADGVTLEVVLDADSLAAMTSAFMLADGATLKSLVDPALYRRAVAAMAGQGMPEAMVAAMKPWAVAVTLMTPPSRTGMVLDLLLYRRAIAAGKVVDGLETPMEQMAIFDRLPVKDQLILLEDTLDNLDDIRQMLDALKHAYLARDLQRLVAINETAMGNTDPDLAERFNARLITERNQRMAERLQSRLHRGRQFIAVGALHLPGDEGLLNLLSRRGYRLTRLY